MINDVFTLKCDLLVCVCEIVCDCVRVCLFARVYVCVQSRVIRSGPELGQRVVQSRVILSGPELGQQVVRRVGNDVRTLKCDFLVCACLCVCGCVISPGCRLSTSVGGCIVFARQCAAEGHPVGARIGAASGSPGAPFIIKGPLHHETPTHNAFE
jgi:hypothetical protein